MSKSFGVRPRSRSRTLPAYQIRDVIELPKPVQNLESVRVDVLA